jgi:hypothetical protein
VDDYSSQGGLPPPPKFSPIKKRKNGNSKITSTDIDRVWIPLPLSDLESVMLLNVQSTVAKNNDLVSDPLGINEV